jgi:hypothetical protein
MSISKFNPKELRTEQRKALRCSATVMSRANSPQAGRTIDISQKGISVMLPKHLNPGDQYVISFDTTMGSRLVSVNASATLVYSICVGTSGFRTGFQFGPVDANTAQIIKQLSQ